MLYSAGIYSFVVGPPVYCGRAVGVIVRTCGYPGSSDDTVINCGISHVRCASERKCTWQS